MQPLIWLTAAAALGVAIHAAAPPVLQDISPHGAQRGKTFPLYLRGDNLSDAAWSPARPLFGYTLDVRTTSERAVVLSPSDGKTVASIDGRFAGWSPDGQWYLVGRVTGLFAYRLSGGDPVRVGPIGLPMSAASK